MIFSILPRAGGTGQGAAEATGIEAGGDDANDAGPCPIIEDDQSARRT